MRFLLRVAFWLGVIVVLLPRGESQPASNPQIARPVNGANLVAGEAYRIFGAAWSEAGMRARRRAMASLEVSLMAMVMVPSPSRGILRKV